MVEVLDWSRLANTRAPQYLARSLHRGAVIGFPIGEGYLVAACGLERSAVERIRPLAGEELDLAVHDLAAARDWLPLLGSAGCRLARTIWPQPLTIMSKEGIDLGLTARLPAWLGEQLIPEGELRLFGLSNEALRQTAHYLSGPLVLGHLSIRSAQHLAQVGQGRIDVIIDDGPSSGDNLPPVVRVHGNQSTILRQGWLSAKLLTESATCRVVFICTGNTCRSPLAEALCKKRLADRLGCHPEELPAHGYLIGSAGLAAASGAPAAAEAIAVAAAHGADLTKHRSRPLTEDLVDTAEHLLCMTEGHVAALTQVLPEGVTQPRLLSNDGSDVHDPIGQSRQVYEACAQQIGYYLDAFLDELDISTSEE